MSYRGNLFHFVEQSKIFASRKLAQALQSPCRPHKPSKLHISKSFPASLAVHSSALRLRFLSTSLLVFFLDQALDLLVPVSCTHFCASTSGLLPCRLQGVLLLADGISLLEGGFTLRCLQRLSLPDLATRPCTGCATDTPAVRPFRSSRTKNSSSQISYAHDG